MRLRLHNAIDRDAMRAITEAVLRADLGSRINFELDPEHDAQIVRVENWLTVAETVEAITRHGYAVAAIVDASNETRKSAPAR